MKHLMKARASPQASRLKILKNAMLLLRVSLETKEKRLKHAAPPCLEHIEEPLRQVGAVDVVRHQLLQQWVQRVPDGGRAHFRHDSDGARSPMGYYGALEWIGK